MMTRRVLILTVIGVVVLIVAGCGARPVAETVSAQAPKFVRGLIEDARPLPDGSLQLPKPGQIVIPAPQVERLEGNAQSAAADILSRHLADDASEDAKRAVKDACSIKDGAEVLAEPTLEEQASQALVNFDGNSTARQRVAGLAKELDSAQNSGQASLMVTVFVICESTELS